MRYRLTEDWLGEYKKGHVFDMDGIGEIGMSRVELSLLIKTGILEEVKEEEWPKVGHGYWYIGWNGMVYQDIWSQRVHEESAKVFGNIFHSKTEALEAAEKIKTLLLSLKK